jgi:hypothetical protein
LTIPRFFGVALRFGAFGAAALRADLRARFFAALAGRRAAFLASLRAAFFGDLRAAFFLDVLRDFFAAFFADFLVAFLAIEFLHDLLPQCSRHPECPRNITSHIRKRFPIAIRSPSNESGDRTDVPVSDRRSSMPGLEGTGS